MAGAKDKKIRIVGLESEVSPEDAALPLHAPSARRRRAGKDDTHPLLERQLMEAADENGRLRVRELIRIVSQQYETFDSDRSSFETVMQIATDEATAMTEALERESAFKLQAILDHVKDGIISCDEHGRIESLNRTAERFFGVKQSDLLSLTAQLGIAFPADAAVMGWNPAAGPRALARGHPVVMTPVGLEITERARRLGKTAGRP